LLSILKVMAAASAWFWNPSFSHLIPVLMAIPGEWCLACRAIARPPFAASIPWLKLSYRSRSPVSVTLEAFNPFNPGRCGKLLPACCRS
jgi:hypothetical protein